VIYLETSVALASILAEQRSPPERMWNEQIVSSRLLRYEMWTRIHAYGLTQSHADDADTLIGTVEFVELSSEVLARALEPFPVPLRTLDALHLSTVEYLRADGHTVELASYDKRILAGARALGIPIYEA
jgi:hypothetical protein